MLNGKSKIFSRNEFFDILDGLLGLLLDIAGMTTERVHDAGCAGDVSEHPRSAVDREHGLDARCDDRTIGGRWIRDLGG